MKIFILTSKNRWFWVSLTDFQLFLKPPNYRQTTISNFEITNNNLAVTSYQKDFIYCLIFDGLDRQYHLFLFFMIISRSSLTTRFYLQLFLECKKHSIIRCFLIVLVYRVVKNLHELAHFTTLTTIWGIWCARNKWCMENKMCRMRH